MTKGALPVKLSPLPIFALTAGLLVASCAGGSGQNRSAGSMAMGANQQISPPAGLMFAGLDSDRDAIVTTEEIRDAVPAMFALSDFDDDGVLTGIEFSDWSAKHMGASHTTPGRMRFDRDQNNQISLEEFAMTIDGMVQRFDRNQDGQLERSELLMTVTEPDMGAMRAQMEGQMRARARQMCRQQMGRRG